MLQLVRAQGGERGNRRQVTNMVATNHTATTMRRWQQQSERQKETVCKRFAAVAMMGATL